MQPGLHPIEAARRALAAAGFNGGTIFYTAEGTTAAVALAQSSASQIRFARDGWAVALTVSEDAGTAANLATTGIRCQMADGRDLYTDGQAPAFMRFTGIAGLAYNYQPIMRRVQMGDLWQITFRTQNAVAKSCFASFAVIEDR